MPEGVIKSFLPALMELGVEVFVEHYHLPAYPVDIDDVAFVLCAVNGDASHLVTYDRHLFEVSRYYSFKVCETIEFLRDLRQVLRTLFILKPDDQALILSARNMAPKERKRYGQK